jgi:UDP-N-acetylglucosamine 2-epimerase (non-hydrolysing)
MTSEMKKHKKKILCVFGTRPEAIKMAPIIIRLREEGWAQVICASTSQHREMLRPTIDFFRLQVDFDLDVMSHDQSLNLLTSSLLSQYETLLKNIQPDLVIAQGDTTSVMALALSCFHLRITFAHVEAGLRTGNLSQPFPEEANRIIASLLATIHFSPTEESHANLVKEGVPEGAIFITGNTVIDSLKIALGEFSNKQNAFDKYGKYVLITCHRRESFGGPLYDICRSIKSLASCYQAINFVFPVHLNPNIRNVVFRELNNTKNIILLDPIDYPEFAQAMSACYFIMTDSGGIQEEATFLGKPTLVLRQTTERPESLKTSNTKLVGTDYEQIVSNAKCLFRDETLYRKMATPNFTYGDGFSSFKISHILHEYLLEK